MTLIPICTLGILDFSVLSASFVSSWIRKSSLSCNNIRNLEYSYPSVAVRAWAPHQPFRRWSKPYEIHERINCSSLFQRERPMSFGWPEAFNLIDSMAMMGASAIPFYVSYATKIKPFRILSLLLALFAFSHGLYHLLFGFVLGYAARAVLDSFSVVMLLAFLSYFAKKGGFA